MKHVHLGWIVLMAGILMVGCSPVLSRSLMKEGVRDVPLAALRVSPDEQRGRLFVLGGVIVETKMTEQGSQIEALAVPVNKYGYLRDEIRAQDGRFLAIYPKELGFLEPMIFKKGRTVTLAGTFTGNRIAKIDEVEYTYPVFEIRQIYLWQEPSDYAYPYYYPYYSYPYPYGWYDPWWRPYSPYWYRPPPW